MHKLYRLYTENKNKTAVAELCAVEFPGFTLLEGRGYWQGQSEDCLVVEIILKDGTESCRHEYAAMKIKRLAGAIKARNEQSAVLVTVQDVEVEYV